MTFNEFLAPRVANAAILFALLSAPSGAAFGGEGDDKESADSIAATAYQFQTGGIYGAAAAEWEKLLQLHPMGERSREAMLNLGRCYYSLKRYQHAAAILSACDQSFEAFGKSPESLSMLAMAQTQLARAGNGKYADAAQTYQRAFDCDPNGDFAPGALLSQSLCLYADNRFEAARECVARLIADWEDQPQVIDAWHQLGMIEKRLGNTTRAAEAFEKVSQQWPKHWLAANAHFELGQFLLQQDKPLKASEHFRAAAERMDYLHADFAQLKFAQALNRAGKSEAALQAYEALPRDFPKSKYCEHAKIAAERLLRTPVAPKAVPDRAPKPVNADRP